jgi:hypothetical protein
LFLSYALKRHEFSIKYFSKVIITFICVETGKFAFLVLPKEVFLTSFFHHSVVMCLTIHAFSPDSIGLSVRRKKYN